MAQRLLLGAESSREAGAILRGGCGGALRLFQDGHFGHAAAAAALSVSVIVILRAAGAAAVIRDVDTRVEGKSKKPANGPIIGLIT